MRWTATAAVAKLPTKNAPNSTQNTTVRDASRSVIPGPGLGGPPLARVTTAAVPRRRVSAWVGIVTTGGTAARVGSALRQATRTRNHASIRLENVGANPATSLAVRR